MKLLFIWERFAKSSEVRGTYSWRMFRIDKIDDNFSRECALRNVAPGFFPSTRLHETSRQCRGMGFSVPIRYGYRVGCQSCAVVSSQSVIRYARKSCSDVIVDRASPLPNLLSGQDLIFRFSFILSSLFSPTLLSFDFLLSPALPFPSFFFLAHLWSW